MKYRAKLLALAAVLLVLVIVALKPFVHLITESWWFDAIGFASIFWQRWRWQVLIWLTTFLGYGLFLWGNYWLAMHHTRQQPIRLFDDQSLESLSETVVHVCVAAVVGLISVTIAGMSADTWDTILKFLNATQFGQQDPVFQRDLGFYIFQLPFYEGLQRWLFSLVAISLLTVGLVYLLKGVIATNQRGAMQIQPRIKRHLTLLLCLLLFLLGWQFWLDRYALLYQSGGVVFGIGYTDRYARLLANQIMSLACATVAVLLLLNLRRRNFSLELRSGLALLLLMGVVHGGLPWFMQQFLVSPTELLKEKPFLANNIKLTQAAYDLSAVQQEQYQPQAKLTRQSIQANADTIRNIRLWDYRPLLSTYRQLQEIRLYYKFSDVDIDRYTFNDTYQQIVLSAREMSHERLPTEAQTWVNQHLKYTHGYGLAMSPVNQVSSDGLPEFYVKNIPPASNVKLDIAQPEIYYGEETDSYIFTGMTTDEFDYPLSSTNAFTRYDGMGGVKIPTFWQRLLYAYDLKSLQILISNYFAPSAKIHYYRSIKQRIEHVAPFLKYDHDPYLVIADGHLQWVMDAYTTSEYYPYSQPFRQSKEVESILQDDQQRALVDDNLNYIRNSVKVVVDAYDGSLKFFVADEADPVIQTYRKIFPQLFTGIEDVSPALREHFRYPMDLFKIQMQMYLTYHMNDPEVFYNREDQWRFPKQVYEDSDVLVTPYYVIMRLPQEQQPEFLMIQPFTPVNKENMVAWIAARSNGNGAGKLLLYEFPKQSLVYGPRQIESRIDQSPNISQQFTLWSQAGSRVIRGDLLVIPIDESLLYIEPIYLRAEQSELPQLKRVIVAYDRSVVMEDSLDKALAAVFGPEQVTPLPQNNPPPGGAAAQSSPAPKPSIPAVEPTVKPTPTAAPAAKPSIPAVEPSAKPTPTAAPSPKKPLSPNAKAALDRYRKAQAALQKGDWEEYGRQQKALEKLLKKLQ
ncbi:UPF0182 family protein [filamentous cyanobacterium LEGE 11480]|uniref:UPF0182 protein IQ266_21225 n=1 Tax=Romeriopsis navalis LEGE 11480 TaxID=2777977 RepID=A0A928VPT4_9CYAN|nr:UPF0182 family protein [Romeriopsis navalis]MBE9032265.1 UPF0182 family protein [Romeriopsis navalis LEGE 11480]